MGKICYQEIQKWQPLSFLQIYFIMTESLKLINTKTQLLTLQMKFWLSKLLVADPKFYFNQLLPMFLPRYDVDCNMSELVLLKDFTLEDEKHDVIRTEINKNDVIFLHLSQLFNIPLSDGFFIAFSGKQHQGSPYR